MKINIKATGIELTPAISDYAYKKIFTIEKYLPSDSNPEDVVASIEVGKSTKHHKSGNFFRAEVHVTGTGLDLYAVCETEDLYASIDAVRDEIVRNTVQSKGKRQTIARRGAEMMKRVMKGLSEGTAKGFRWSVERLKFKGLRSFKGFKKRP